MNRPKVFSFPLFVLPLVFTPLLYADTVLLKNGNEVQGIVVREDDEKVILQFEKDATVEFSRNEVAKITQDSEEEKAALRSEWEKTKTPAAPTKIVSPAQSAPPPPRQVVLQPTTGKESDLLLSQGSWQVRKTQHFTVYHQDTAQGKAITNRAEYYLEKIVDDLRVRKIHDRTHKYTVVVVKERPQWEEFLKQLNIEPELTGGFATGAAKREIFLFSSSIPYLTLAFPHELTHILLDEIARGRKLPLWFDEGFANYEGAIIGIEEELLTEALRNGTHIPLLELVQSKTYPEETDRRKLFYTEAERLVEFLITQYGRRRFGEFTEALLKTGDFTQAIHSAYGGKISHFEQLEELWLKYLSE